jgi:hypothetical protein
MENTLDLLGELRSPEISGIKPIVLTIYTRVHDFLLGEKKRKGEKEKKKEMLEVRWRCRKICS